MTSAEWRSQAKVAGLRCMLVLGGLALGTPDAPVAGQSAEVSRRMLQLVVPEADRFGEKQGRPPVFPAYRTDPDSGEEELVGYAFLTPDVPPERVGYSGPIDALVGIDLRGVVTGMRVVWYYESYMSQMGDFLRREGFQEQFSGKSIGDAFLVRSDIQGISRATVSSRAVSRGVRDAARRVANAYLERPEVPDEIPVPSTLSWLELQDREVVESMLITEDGEEVLAEVWLAHIDSWATAEHLVGPTALGMTTRAVESRTGNEHVMVYGLDGPNPRVFTRSGWSVVQGSDTLRLQEADVFPFGLAGAGLFETEMSTSGAMILPAELDIARPFELQLDLRPQYSTYVTQYVTLASRATTAAQAAPTEPTADALDSSGAAEPAPEVAATDEPAPGATDDPSPLGLTEPAGTIEHGGIATTSPEPEGSAADVEVELSTADLRATANPSLVPTAATSTGDANPSEALDSARQVLDFGTTESESLLDASLAGTSWVRVWATLGLLLLVSLAFARKGERLRWATLAITLGYLGFVDGGFLSVSHITSAIWVGASAFLNDLPLLLVASFTVLTTIVFGRVFCGFLCPFGALQDFLTKLVPRRVQRRVPDQWHRPGLLVKYVALGVILVPALLGAHTSIYSYFEPFGTVFFLSPSVVLWSIALGFLAASAVVPRFYCRYVCPLGAALALGSLVAVKRIGRVEQCTHCKVCENACPTGAIRGAEIDFKECVRCNTCETLLIEKAGVCQHHMDDVRPRLVQLKISNVSGR